MKKPYIEMIMPSAFRFSPASAAEFLGVGVKVVRANIKRSPKDRFYLKSHQHTPGGEITIYAYDLEDYLNRTQIGIERQEAA